MDVENFINSVKTYIYINNKTWHIIYMSYEKFADYPFFQEYIESLQILIIYCSRSFNETK